jgi:DNA-binding IclR family transcriptional regulator
MTAQHVVTTDQPLDRLLCVLRVVANAARPMTMTQVATECALPLPTVHRLLAQLMERGLLKYLPGSKKLTVGFALVSLGAAAVDAAMRADPIHDVLVSLSARIGEHCQIGHRVDNDVVYLDAVHAARSQGLHFEHGRHSPLYCTSIGKLFLADMPREAFERWLTQVELKAVAPNTIVSADRLRRVIDGVRKQQWASSNEEMAAGVVGCAVPIRDANGQLVAGLGVSAPSARLPFGQIDQFREPMRAAAAEISSRLSAD